MKTSEPDDTPQEEPEEEETPGYLHIMEYLPIYFVPTPQEQEEPSDEDYTRL